VHVTVGVALPRWLRCGAEWMYHTLIAPHSKFQMQRRCSGGDRSESHPSRPLLKSSVEGGVHVTVGAALPRWLRCGAEWMDHTLIAPHTTYQIQRKCSCGDTSETDPP